MEWFRQLGRAIRNLSRIARQNPIWAITALVVSPIRLIRHLFAGLILAQMGLKPIIVDRGKVVR